LGSGDVGIIGLGTMGENLTLNLLEKGFRVSVYNRSPERTRRFVEVHGQAGRVVPTFSVKELVSSLKPPRKVLVLVKAGQPVDDVIEQLSGLLEPGDVLADLGNSHFRDTERRLQRLSGSGVLYAGIGVSGGERGARYGACFMAGGPAEAFEHLAPILRPASADTGEGPACAYLGPRGAGHYVKMVHNGIEYAMLEVIAEAYDILRRGFGIPSAEISATFRRWSRGDLSSFLMEAASQACLKRDPETGRPLVELIEDVAEQKGTGRWCVQDALELGVPTPTIDAAVSQRNLSSLRTLRGGVARAIGLEAGRAGGGEPPLHQLEQAVFCSFLTAFAQGFSQLQAASTAYGYNLDLAEVARVWGGGCIIRARMIEAIKKAYRSPARPEHLFLDPEIAAALRAREGAWRETVALAMSLRIPTPAISTALAYYYSLGSERLPANLIQALRDLFGAHGFRRVDRAGQFHADWGWG
jgi:6-phosphogluconate dehydrogenase